MAKICAYCDKNLAWPDIFNCYYCQKTYCDKHYQAENHECPKVVAAKHIDKDYLRRKGVNITTGRYRIVCKNCGFTTEYLGIEKANQKRIDHIQNSNCPSEQVLLRQHEEDKKDDSEFMRRQSIEFSRDHEVNDWMYDCLNKAKSILLEHHNSGEIINEYSFSLFVQSDMPNAYGYIMLGAPPHFQIGIHQALSEDTERNRRMVTIVLVHELLHTIYGKDEGKVSYEEKILANRANHFDALIEMQNLALTGKMRFCNN